MHTQHLALEKDMSRVLDQPDIGFQQPVAIGQFMPVRLSADYYR